MNGCKAKNKIRIFINHQNQYMKQNTDPEDIFTLVPS